MNSNGLNWVDLNKLVKALAENINKGVFILEVKQTRDFSRPIYTQGATFPVSMVQPSSFKISIELNASDEAVYYALQKSLASDEEIKTEDPTKRPIRLIELG